MFGFLNFVSGSRLRNQVGSYRLEGNMVSEFKSKDVVWVKCGQLFWPAQVESFDDLPSDIKQDFDQNKLPKVIAKFFDEDG